MNRLITAALAALACATAAPALAGDVSVSIGINQPGFYGQINLGGIPAPQVIYAQPVVVQPPAVAWAQAPEPIYLHVPPGHERHWRRHCAEYDACGRPVYFVDHDWYRREYAPRHEHRDWERDADREHHHDHDQDRDRDERHGRDERRD